MNSLFTCRLFFLFRLPSRICSGIRVRGFLSNFTDSQFRIATDSRTTYSSISINTYPKYSILADNHHTDLRLRKNTEF